jgi:hypothetical protein
VFQMQPPNETPTTQDSQKWIQYRKYF